MMRTKAIKALALATVATACLAAATITTENRAAKADGVFQMVDGAGVRMDDTADKSAIRFIANVADLTDRDYRMLIVPTAVLKDRDIAADATNVVQTLKTAYGENYDTYFLDMEVTPFEHEKYGNCVMGAMKEINANRYAEEYTGIAYYMSGDDYVYANFSEGVDIYSNARSVSYVASAALNSGEYETSEKATQKGILEGFVASSLDGDTYDIAQSDEVAKIGDSIDLTDNVADTTYLDVKYVSSNTDVVTVDEKGKVTVAGKGNATVTATIGSSFSDTVEFTTFTAGDEATMRLATNYTATGTDFNKNYYANLSTDVKEFADGQTKPYDDATLYIEYSMTTSAMKQSGYEGRFLNFSADTPISDVLLEKYKNVDWNDAYISFWVYNDTEYTFELFSGTSSAWNTSGWRSGKPTARTWTQVTISLADYFSVSKNAIETGDYGIYLYVYYQNTGCQTEDTYQNLAGKFYVAGFEFFTPTVETVEEMIADNYRATGTDYNRLYYANLATAVKAFDAVPSELPNTATSYVEYRMTTTKEKSSSYEGNFLDFSASNPIDAAILTQYADVDWDNAYIRFWVYNDTDYTFKIFPGDNSAFNSSAGWRSEPVAKTWTKVEISLKDYFSVTADSIADGTYNIKLYAYFTGISDCNSADTYQNFLGKFYVAGFEFVSAADIA